MAATLKDIFVSTMFILVCLFLIVTFIAGDHEKLEKKIEKLQTTIEKCQTKISDQEGSS